MMRRPAVLIWTLLVFVLLSGRVSAQVTCPPSSGRAALPKNTSLSTVIYQLYCDEIGDNISIFEDRGLDPPEGIEGDLVEALIITQAIGNQLSTFPLGSSAGGFSWTFDTTAGSFTRNATSFGPLFSERALTVGRGKLNFGVNYQRATYDEFEGRKLRDREIGFFTFFGRNISGRRVFGDDSLSLKLSMDTVGFFANYGLTDRFDVGVALPIVSVDLKADLRFVFRDETGAELPTQTFASPRGPLPITSPFVRAGGRRKTGLGDIILRTKYNFLPLNVRRQGIAVGLDVRLPTGDEENLLGIPGTQAKLFGIVSSGFGRFSPHANVGYTFSRGNAAAKDPDSVLLAPPDEVNYTAGVDVEAVSRLTLSVEFVGRTMRDVPRLTFGDVGLGPVFPEFSFDRTGKLHLPLLAIGGKFNPYGNLLVSANVFFPLTDAGLRDRWTPVVGFEYSF